jgi:hypothetical protein
LTTIKNFSFWQSGYAFSFAITIQVEALIILPVPSPCAQETRVAAFPFLPLPQKEKVEDDDGNDANRAPKRWAVRIMHIGSCFNVKKVVGCLAAWYAPMCEILTYWLNHHKRISLSNGSKWLETDWGIILALLKELPRPWENCNLNRRMECCARTNERPYRPYHWFGLREMWRTRNPPFPRPSMNVCFLQVSPEPILGGYLRWKIWQNCLPRIVSWICRIGWFRVHEHIFKNVTVQHTWPTVIWYSDIVGHSILWYNRVLHYITFHSTRFHSIPLYTILHCTTWNCSSGHYVSFIHIAMHYPNII